MALAFEQGDVAFYAEARRFVLDTGVSESGIHLVPHYVLAGTFSDEFHLVPELHAEGVAYVDGQGDLLLPAFGVVAHVRAVRSVAGRRVVLVGIAEVVSGEVERIAPLVTGGKIPFALVIQGAFSGAGEIPLGLPSLAVDSETPVLDVHVPSGSGAVESHLSETLAGSDHVSFLELRFGMAEIERFVG